MNLKLIKINVVNYCAIKINICNEKTAKVIESEDLENFTEDFIKTLFFCRTLFDRYIVKTLSDNNSEDGERWTLRKPKKESGKWYYVNTFDDEYKQNRIVKALTMLQVS